MRLRPEPARGNGTGQRPSVDDPAAPLGDLRLSQAALDAVQANISGADRQSQLVSRTRRATQSLDALGHDVRQAFGVRFGELLSERLRSGTAKLPLHATFTFGAVTIEARISEVAAPDGGVAGYVVAWDDVSADRVSDQRTEALSDRLKETQEVSAAIQAVASATEEMAASANEIARNATEATRTVQAAVSVVDSANQTMSELGGAPGEISDISTPLTPVAEQTNLLALNATIEAARAGESGKGFAVVAGEVKELSKQTKAATERINEMIGGIQRPSQAAMTAVGKFHHVAELVTQNNDSIASAVEQQTATTQEISANLADAARRAEEIAAFVSSG